MTTSTTLELKSRHDQACEQYAENVSRHNFKVAGFWASEAERYARLLLLG